MQKNPVATALFYLAVVLIGLLPPAWIDPLMRRLPAKAGGLDE